MKQPTLNLQRIQKLRRIFQYGSIFVLLLFVALILYSSKELYRIRASITAGKVELKKLKVDSTQKQKEINDQNDLIIQKQDSVDALAQTIYSIKAQDPKLIPLINGTVEINLLRSDTMQIRPRIYIQIANENQMNYADKLTKQLRSKGFLVPGIENMDGKTQPPNRPELRYYDEKFFQSDLDLISQTLKSAAWPNLKQVRLKKSLGVRSRHYEIWCDRYFPSNAPDVILDIDTKKRQPSPKDQ